MLAVSLRFEGGVIDNLVHEIRQVYRGRRDIVAPALDARQCEELTYQISAAVRLQSEAVQQLRCRLRAALSRQSQGNEQARQRRPQLVRNVAQQAFVAIDQCFESLGHSIEVAAELPDFVPAVSDL